MRRTVGWVVALGLLGGPVHAQFLSPGGVTSGFQGQAYSFGKYFGVRSLRQWAVPLAAVLPAGRFSFDAGAYYASTTQVLRDGSALTVTGLTDTQVRGAMVIGQDAAVVTMLVNLPTGASRLTRSEYKVLSGASSSFLAFPVNAYGSGPSVTAGVATAVPTGPWNLGIAGSVRYSGAFAPISDPEGDFSYRAGFEGRLRLGVDRLIGSSRLSFGMTYSNFSNDEFSRGTGVTGVYRPGARFIAEMSYAGAVGPVSLVGYAWDYLRLAGDSAGTEVPNRENVLNVGTTARVPLSRTISWEPTAEFRLTNPEVGKAILVELSSGFRIRATRRLTVVPAFRVDLGRLEDPILGHPIRGFGMSVFVRESF